MPDQDFDRSTSPWHAGELALQESVGVVERMDRPGRLFVRRVLIDQHRAFYNQLPFVLLGSVDPEGNVWATMRAGLPGFLASPDPLHLSIDLPRDPQDPADAGMGDGAAIGMLGIELETRRRNRMNGTIHRNDASGFSVEVGQAFGNCPQYIQIRKPRYSRDPALPSPVPPVYLAGLDARAREIIGKADTFFVASYTDRENGERQVDVSHRGGPAGFVRLEPDGALTVPDFSGNQFFNTLGNFVVNPRAGLLFVDFATGDVLQITGTVELILSSPDIAAFEGAERLWRVTPTAVVHRREGVPLTWGFDDSGWSPELRRLGHWPAAGSPPAAVADGWRPFRISHVEDESAVIRSLYLEPADGWGILPHLPGQHFTLRLAAPDGGAALLRNYTISSAPADGVYRISVKREGAASQVLHGLKVGDSLEIKPPSGAFMLDSASPRPVVMLAAGVGITPMIAMLRHMLHAKDAGALPRVTLFQSARTAAERAFDKEIASLVAASEGRFRWVRVLSQPGAATPAGDHDATGRIDMDLLRRTLPFDDHDFYLCGPSGFMQEIYDGLRGMSVADARIHAESFGPSSLRRSADFAAPALALLPVAQEPVQVVFSQTGQEALWTPGDGPLLGFAESQGLAPEYSCRSGTCGTCRTRVLEGSVTYAEKPAFQPAEGEALICCAYPAKDSALPLRLAL